MFAKQLRMYQIPQCLLRAAGSAIEKDVYIGEDLILIGEPDYRGQP